MSRRASPPPSTTRGAGHAGAGTWGAGGGRGFTLVELLVVVGLVAVLVGVVGLALGDAGGNALGTAQKQVASLVGAARARAAVAQTETILAIYGTRPPQGEADKFLRLMQVFENSNPGGTPTWVPAGSPVTLPRGVYLVPSSTTGLLQAGTPWPTNPPLLSSVRGPIGLVQPAGTAFGTPATAYVIEFSADGTVTQVGTQAHARVVVATAALANNIPQFGNSASVRGILIRPTGAVTFVNEAVGF